ncbi:MAG: MerR family DNA-binding transcriptional regulator [Microbacterium enclense]
MNTADTTPFGGRRLTIGEVAAISGVAASAIRFYERQELFRAERTDGNQRRYSETVPCLVRVARVAQRVGLSVREIRDLFEALSDDPPLEEWMAMDEQLVREAERRIADLHAVLDDLRSDARLCELPGVDDVAGTDRPRVAAR